MAKKVDVYLLEKDRLNWRVRVQVRNIVFTFGERKCNGNLMITAREKPETHTGSPHNCEPEQEDIQEAYRTARAAFNKMKRPRVVREAKQLTLSL